MRGILVRMQGLKKLKAQVQKELNLLKITTKAEDENLTQLLSELDSLKMIMKTEDEICIELLSDSMRKIEVEDEHPADFQEEMDLVRKMEEEDEQPPHFKYEGDSVRNRAMRAEERRLGFQQVEDIIPVKLEEVQDENDAYFQNEMNSLRKIMMVDEHPTRFRNEVDLERNLAMRAEKPRFGFQEVEDIIPVTLEEDEQPSHFQAEMDLVRKMEEEDEQPPHFKYEGDSVRNRAMRPEEPRLGFQQVEDIIPVKLEEVQDENNAYFQNGLNSLRKIMMVNERPTRFRNEVDLVRNLAMRAEKPRLGFQQDEDIIPVKLEEVQNENDAYFQNELNSLRKIMIVDERPTRFWNEVDLVRNLAMRAEKPRRGFQQFEDIIPVTLEEDDYDTHSQDEVDYVKIKTERLPMILLHGCLMAYCLFRQNHGQSLRLNLHRINFILRVCMVFDFLQCYWNYILNLLESETWLFCPHRQISH
jgi:hypothetical protein